MSTTDPTGATPVTSLNGGRPEDALPQDEDAGAGLTTDVGLRAAFEAVLMVADDPVPAAALARATGIETDDAAQALRELAGSYDEEGRGFELREVAGGWRMYSRAAHADVVEAFLLDGQTAKLTQAALETLAIVAYRQPVSRSRVSAVRGVAVDGVMRTLLTRGLVSEAGVEATSGATLYRTTAEFLHRMGLESLEQLPPLAPFLPDDVPVEDVGPPEVLAVPARVPAVAPAADVEGSSMRDNESFAAVAPDGDASGPDREPDGTSATDPVEDPRHDQQPDQQHDQQEER
ncbi:SMC-Scp complex subunit ScpB [Kineococcus gynurae]|uniref:SMC-Scp complex subunit ScpB n=1 Tax=Kineococcus gynurae TaxID=452979 RepID=A0ABV5LXT3_9ACTN